MSEHYEQTIVDSAMADKDDTISNIDQSPISPSLPNATRKNSLDYHLTHRPDRQELVNSTWLLYRFCAGISRICQSQEPRLTGDSLSLREHPPCVNGRAQPPGPPERGKQHPLVRDGKRTEEEDSRGGSRTR